MRAGHVLSLSAAMFASVAILGALWFDTADHSDPALSSVAADTGNVLNEAGLTGDLATEDTSDPALLPDQDYSTGFYFHDGGEWLWCPHPLTGFDCNVPYRK